ncbi:piggyBac transposable element-derived protein 4-like [Rhinichthys klamathensis goyatoka]|uniref:piggyBac transposable element-derived protein 4-like n=1 Tax=Rhinichthys klamathensis goyatoka TaxID=3034132 RepID=UPI0024B60EB4|nr:piggyBac transposable element-derived protein 4-like [Rhinichthys klamathensis goyatoka]
MFSPACYRGYRLDQSPPPPSGTEDDLEVDPDFQVIEDHQPSEDDSEEEGPRCDPSFTSKNGEIIWSSSPPLQTPGRARAEEIIRRTPGPTRYAISRAEDIKSTFELYFPRSIQTILVTMTNMEGRRVYGDQWKEIDWTEMEAFMGLLILAGVLKSNGESTRSLWDGEMGRAIFRATMPLKDFIKLSGVIRFDKSTRSQRRETDKLAPIRELWEKWVERLSLMYNPDMYVTVDERLIGFRGRCHFKQYMPSKPAKYGLKIWAACDAKSSYSHNMQVYTGKPAGAQREQNLGKRVVLDMVHDLKGHVVTCDNFFTSYALGTELLQKKIRMLGTVRKNRTELPSALVTMQNRPPHSSLFGCTETHTIVSYSPQKKKNVILMSTMHKDAAVSDREDRKPIMILDYNATKGGVDNLDKIVATYTCARKTARWPMAIFFNILNVSAYNSFVLWREINPTWGQLKSYRRRLFLEELGKALVYPFMKRRPHIPRTPASVSFLKWVKDSRDEEAGPSSSSSAGPPTAGPSSSSSAGPPTAGPSSSSSAGPSTAGPSSSSSAGPSTAGPSSAGPPTAGPSSASSAGPPTAGPSSAGLKAAKSKKAAPKKK